jgi:hypothetical protein
MSIGRLTEIEDETVPRGLKSNGTKTYAKEFRYHYPKDWGLPTLQNKLGIGRSTIYKILKEAM